MKVNKIDSILLFLRLTRKEKPSHREVFFRTLADSIQLQGSPKSVPDQTAIQLQP